MDRRQFVKQGTLSLAALAGASLSAASIERPLQADDVVTLGRSKLLASRQSLGLGDGTAEAFQKMGQAGFTRLIRHTLDKGARYFDLLPGPSHGMLAEALKGVPREMYTLVTNFRHLEEQNPAKMDAPAGKQVTETEKRDLSVPPIADIHAAGIGTAGMKIFSHSGYRDAGNPAEERLNAIRYVMSLHSIDTMPIMCESIQEFDEVRGMIERIGRG
jgi:hypothetical protein